MIPQLISNIILALIAIVALYTMAPLIRDILTPFTGQKKKKSMSKNDFDDMVKRRTEQLSGAQKEGAIAGSRGQEKIKSDLSSLKDQGYFIEGEYNKILSLKDSLQWGINQNIRKEIQEINTLYGLNINDNEIIPLLKEILNKNNLIKIFKKGSISETSIYTVLKNKLVINELIILHPDFKSTLSKKLNLPPQSISPLIMITLAKYLSKDWLKDLNKWLKKETIDLNNYQIKIIEMKEDLKLLNELKKNIEIIYPLSDLGKSDIEKIFPKEKKEIKKKYKRLVTEYHPDKWNYAVKSKEIETKLNTNFNLINEVYNNLM